MKKPILISLAVAGGAVLAAGAVYLAKKLKNPEYCENYDDCDACCDCYMDGPEESEENTET